MVAWSRKNPGEIGCTSEVESIRHTDTLNLREKRADLRYEALAVGQMVVPYPLRMRTLLGELNGQARRE